jgi:hypothetical protein
VDNFLILSQQPAASSQQMENDDCRRQLKIEN